MHPEFNSQQAALDCNQVLNSEELIQLYNETTIFVYYNY